jgi:tetratricopeptide (TPR) repeat protein
MYLRTPAKYRRRRQPIISCWRLVLMFGAVCLIVIGIGIYQNAYMFQPEVNALVRNVESSLNDLQLQAQTAAAPPPTATADPRNDLISANNAWDRGAVSEAMRVYDSILDSVPNDVDVYYRMTLGMIIQGDIDAALAFAEDTVTANPFSSEAWAIRAWALDWAGRSGEAIASGLHAKELDPQNPRALAFLAEAYYSAGQVQRGYDMTEQALKLDSESVEALRARGFIAWFGLFDTDTALQSLQTGYQLAQQSNPAYAGLIAIDIARLDITTQNYDAAKTVLESVLELNPDNSIALYWLGSVYFGNLGDPSQAASYLQRCVDTNPTSINCHYLLGRTQARLDQMSIAAGNFNRAVELGSKIARHYWWAGNAQIALGNCNLALKYLEPGYEMAKTGTDTQLISDFEAILPLCQAGFSVPVTPTPGEGEETSEDGSEA